MSDSNISLKIGQIFNSEPPMNGTYMLCPVNNFNKCLGSKCTKFMNVYHICNYMCEYYDDIDKCGNCRFSKYADQDYFGFCTL